MAASTQHVVGEVSPTNVYFQSCSVACSREHANDHPTAAATVQVAREPTPPQPAVSQADYEDPAMKILVEHKSEWQALWAKYPFLPNFLNHLNDVHLAPGVDPDIARRNAMDLLFRTRDEPTELGEAVSEFCQLVKLRMEPNWDEVYAYAEEEHARRAAGYPI